MTAAERSAVASLGGKARAERLKDDEGSKQKRSEIARKAAAARWGKKSKKAKERK